MKQLFIILLTIVSSCGISNIFAADLIPGFQNECHRITKDELQRAYITPKSILSTSGDVRNPELLLIRGTGQTDIFDSGMCKMKSTADSTASIIFDFGKELTGGVRITISTCTPQITPRFRIRLGESVSEACSELKSNIGSKSGNANSATNDHAIRDFTLSLPFYGQLEVGNSGFRFLRIDLLDPDVTVNLKEIEAIMRYRDIPYLGSFKCNDARLNEIWETGAYTVHLCMQENLWDGVKRDRLIWLGDMHPETATIATVFGCHPIVEQTLDLACKQWPLPQWFNGMSAYSLWYLIIQNDWYNQSANRKFLESHGEYILKLIDRIDECVDETGKENLAEWRFLDWPSSSNPQGVEAGYRALIQWAMQAGENLATQLGDKQKALTCRKIRNRINKIQIPHYGLKQAAALMAIAGNEEANKACESCISIGAEKGFSTFGGYYMLEALAKANRHQEALERIRNYWGAMLDMGATTFWEDFDMDWIENAAPITRLPREGGKDIHANYGGYCYVGHRHSFCHGWASGPTAWLSRYVLGIECLEPGFKKIKVNPHLGDLEWAEGTYPTPHGIIKVSHKRLPNGKINTKISVPEGIKVVR